MVCCLLLQKQITLDDEPEQLLHAVVVGSQLDALLLEEHEFVVDQAAADSSTGGVHQHDPDSLDPTRRLCKRLRNSGVFVNRSSRAISLSVGRAKCFKRHGQRRGSRRRLACRASKIGGQLRSHDP